LGWVVWVGLGWLCKIPRWKEVNLMKSRSWDVDWLGVGSLVCWAWLVSENVVFPHPMPEDISAIFFRVKHISTIQNHGYFLHGGFGMHHIFWYMSRLRGTKSISIFVKNDTFWNFWRGLGCHNFEKPICLDWFKAIFFLLKGGKSPFFTIICENMLTFLFPSILCSRKSKPVIHEFQADLHVSNDKTLVV